MNNDDRKILDVLQSEVQNNTKQLEAIIKNELPHMKKDLSWIIGRLSVLSPLAIGIAVGLFLLIVGLVCQLIFGG